MTVVCAGNKSSTGKITEGQGECFGIMVASSSSLTLKVWDSVDGTGNVLLNTTAPITAPFFIPLIGNFSNGLFVTVGGSGNFSVMYERLG